MRMKLSIVRCVNWCQIISSMIWVDQVESCRIFKPHFCSRNNLQLHEMCYVHSCARVIGMFFHNQIWSRSLEINRLCLVCIKRSIEEVKKCQISKHGYHKGPSDKTLKKARCQFCDVKFGHRIMETVGIFDYEMNSFIQITFNFTNKWSKDVVWWFTDMILHKWYFHKL